MQNVFDVAGELTWGDSQVTAFSPLKSCGPYVFELVTQSGTAIDAEVFITDSLEDPRSVSV